MIYRPKEFRKEHKGIYLAEPHKHGVQRKLIIDEEEDVS